MSTVGVFPDLTPEEAAARIPNGATVAFSGFTNSGAAKLMPRAIASRAHELHQKGEPYKIRVLTGASDGESIDEPLAEAEAISWRAPYQSASRLRRQINNEEVEYVDMHLSQLSQTLLAGFHEKLNFAVVEATEVTPDGRVYLDHLDWSIPRLFEIRRHYVLIEINDFHSKRLREMADILIFPPPPHRVPVPLHDPLTKLGMPYALVDPRRIMGIIQNNEPDRVAQFTPGDARKR